jgi:hypothetical protein
VTDVGLLQRMNDAGDLPLYSNLAIRIYLTPLASGGV